ncbi:hypothetical protein ABENE_15815 [Asticcacaulis benevestitus DSM 16100 = ATCC BAA-896]|uniref:Uncharacterized protein n=1 Tax=Asticcacaulis benevestitus DSM 16100 = ATCC BAA-896 TaxID=1121022 RepID=V4P3F4_9CAUL|nr:hypothetical protein ABENE_15815 [Asticcacaulis benevestitus DSM 16100 = ATCC BAA-896]
MTYKETLRAQVRSVFFVLERGRGGRNFVNCVKAEMVVCSLQDKKSNQALLIDAGVYSFALLAAGADAKAVKPSA